MNNWAKLFLLAFFMSFLIPGVYLFGLENLFNGGLLKGVEYFIYLLLVPMAIYPFWKGVLFYKQGNKLVGVFSIMLGIILPIVTGMFGMFIFEVLFLFRGKGKKDIHIELTRADEE